MKEAHERVKEELEATVKKRNDKQYGGDHHPDQHKEYTEFKVGDQVLMRVPRVPKGKSLKLAAQWRGPYEVLQPINNKVTYLIKVIGNNKCKPLLAHISRLKPYIVNEDEAESNEEDSETETGLGPSLSSRDHDSNSNAEEHGLEEGQLSDTETEEGELKFNSDSDLDNKNNIIGYLSLTNKISEMECMHRTMDYDGDTEAQLSDYGSKHDPGPTTTRE